VHKANTEITSMRVWKGEQQNLSLGLVKDVYITIPKGLGAKVKNSLKLEAMIVAPVAQGQSYGKIDIVLDDKKLASRELVALSAINEGSIWRKLIDNIKLMFQ
jgi:D-alanyl-D-alanine carboxypeptidase (penicillin-binding protein 5/6)